MGQKNIIDVQVNPYHKRKCHYPLHEPPKWNPGRDEFENSFSRK